MLNSANVICCTKTTQNKSYLIIDDKSTVVRVMPSGNKPATEPMLAQIYVAIWYPSPQCVDLCRHMASSVHNVLIYHIT